MYVHWITLDDKDIIASGYILPVRVCPKYYEKLTQSAKFAFRLFIRIKFWIDLNFCRTCTFIMYSEHWAVYTSIEYIFISLIRKLLTNIYCSWCCSSIHKIFVVCVTRFLCKYLFCLASEQISQWHHHLLSTSVLLQLNQILMSNWFKRQNQNFSNFINWSQYEVSFAWQVVCTVI